MKTLGLIGGTSWVSTVDYYRIINQKINERLGGLNAARLILYSMNYEEFKPPLDPEDWEATTKALCDIAKKLEEIGAECIILCANTPHMAADAIQQHVNIPLIHIAEETAKEISKQNIREIGLLGTRMTMEQAFFKDKLSEYGINTILPAETDRNFIHTSIFNELARGHFTEEIKNRYLQIMEELIHMGAKGIILGCTEIPMLIQPGDTTIKTFDTTLIHATAAVNFALENEQEQWSIKAL
jgi:aspartate racemase